MSLEMSDTNPPDKALFGPVHVGKPPSPQGTQTPAEPQRYGGPVVRNVTHPPGPVASAKKS